ncbi:MAG: radical SAM protein [Clostridia bacterium]|nr:radical SAM protein [Clostridia bacterium]
MKIEKAYIEITNICNLNCKTCYNRSGLNKERHEISVKQLEKAILLLSKYGAKRFLISGGEPTLHSEFKKITDLIRKYKNFSFGIVTNGTTGNNNLIELINSVPNCTVQISLDGCSEEDNKLTRGCGSFQKTIDFAKKIEHNFGKTNFIKMVISKDNYKNVEAFYNLTLSLGFTPEFAFIYRSGNATQAWEHKCLTAKEKIQILSLINKLNIQTGTDAFLPKCTTSCPFLSKDNKLGICIKPDGSIQPCQSLYDAKYTLSNIFEFNEEEFSNNLEKIYNLANARILADFGCQKCILNKVCGRGCMAEAENLNSNPLSNDGNCEYRKLQFLLFDLKIHNAT